MIALVFALQGVLALGMIVLFTGAVLTVRAQHRKAGVRAPLVATIIGFVVAVAAAGVLLGDAAVHLTTATFSNPF